MKEDENSPRSPDFKVCPYWRKLVISNDGSILALCGAFSNKKPKVLDFDLGSFWVCPIYKGEGLNYAYKNPTILETKNGEEIHLLQSDMRGQRGIRYLEKRWEEEVAKFRVRHKENQ